MDIATRVDGEELIVVITGDIDSNAAESLLVELTKVIHQGPKRVAMDLSGVMSIGSAGIGKILYFYKELARRKIPFGIRGLHNNLHAIFSSMKLDRLFPIDPK